MVDLRLPKDRFLDNPAPAWKRIASFTVDFFIIFFIVILPLSFSVSSQIPASSSFSEALENAKLVSESSEITGTLILMQVFTQALIFAYFTLFEYKLKQTPGKMVFGLYLAHMDKKEKIGLWAIFMRNVCIIFFFPYLILVDLIYMIFRGVKLSDIISKTQIIEEIKL